MFSFFLDRGNWGNWGDFGPCSKSCGEGVEKRHRYCNNPPASTAGLQCLLADGSGNRDYSESESRVCNVKACRKYIISFLFESIYTDLLELRTCTKL